MTVLAAVLACIAAAIHVYIFALEALWWTTPRGRAVFGTTEAEAATTRQLAFNQGFYNLFLAAMAVIGAVTLLLGHTAVGTTLIVAGCASMALAAVVLVTADRTKGRPAFIQAAAPVLALAALSLTAL